MLIKREHYKKWLDEFRDKHLVKVLTGLRRMDEIFVPDHNGIKTMNIIDFLLGRSELN